MRKTLILLIASCSALSAQVPDTTAQSNLSRTGVNANESILNTSNVGPSTFGLLFTRPVDGLIYTQPLYLPNLRTANGTKQNVVFVATMNNSVYAFDADNPQASNPLWQVNLGPPLPNGSGQTLGPFIGILGTPVIDPVGGTLYVVAETVQNGGTVHTLHGLDVTSGAEKCGGPVVIQASVAGTGAGSSNGMLAFSSANVLQRTALALWSGKIVFGFGAFHENLGGYHGWLFGYNASNLQQFFAVTATAGGSQGGIWMSGMGVAGDSSGMYLVTGNGTFANGNLGQSVLRYTPGQPFDFFTPYNYNLLNTKDWDFGSAGPVLIPNSPYLVAGGKQGVIYLLNRLNLGHIANNDTQVPQSFPATPGCNSSICSEIHNMVYWAPYLYVWGQYDILKVFSFNGNTFTTTPIFENPMISYFPGGIMSLSTKNGAAGTSILWAVTTSTSTFGYAVPGTLHAFDATNVATELWNSNMNQSDTLGYASKFSEPTVTNGKVYVATFSNQLAVYGPH